MHHGCRQHQDWDKLAAEVKKEEKEEKLDGEAGLQKVCFATPSACTHHSLGLPASFIRLSMLPKSEVVQEPHPSVLPSQCTYLFRRSRVMSDML